MGRKESNQTNKITIPQNIVFLSLKIDFVLANNADPKGMLCYVVFMIEIELLAGVAPTCFFFFEKSNCSVKKN